ncbi:AtpZ/AtpI family protein [Rhizobium straminoryzae]|uniref:AtpZ/AtpI family protein n=1 Tax=Rhizobium straminoryzae TaxID=1387186 RepID=A0A549THV1_9HYPH|nr:AtpZ/AtpI family protein [Rhizobium straminoryzae]TRL42685.1 AtpZ/AtpI family protein [Rhizobium straminoryzae]
MSKKPEKAAPRAARPDPRDDRLIEAAHQAAERKRAGDSNPEPPFSRRLAQIGVLGWAIVVPILLGLLAGHWLDRLLSTGILFSAGLIVAGAAVGLWSAWKWMHGHD